MAAALSQLIRFYLVVKYHWPKGGANTLISHASSGLVVGDVSDELKTRHVTPSRECRQVSGNLPDDKTWEPLGVPLLAAHTRLTNVKSAAAELRCLAPNPCRLAGWRFRCLNIQRLSAFPAVELLDEKQIKKVHTPLHIFYYSGHFSLVLQQKYQQFCSLVSLTKGKYDRFISNITPKRRRSVAASNPKHKVSCILMPHLSSNHFLEDWAHGGPAILPDMT